LQKFWSSKSGTTKNLLIVSALRRIPTILIDGFSVPESQKFRVFLKHRKSKTENGNLTIKTTVFLVVESCKSRRLGQISSVPWS
jgi:hypothetical protein